MPLAPYVADPDNIATPSDFISGGYAAAEIRALKGKVNTVVTSVSDEATARANADSALQTAIGDETVARGNAITALTTAVNSSVSRTVRVASSVGGTANTITLGMTPVLAAYAAGTAFVFVPTADSTVSIPTVNIDALGARTIVKASGALAVGDLVAGQPAILVDTGSSLVLSNPQNKGMSLQAFKLTAQAYNYATTKTYTFSHSLGAIPASVQLQLRCTTADAGYGVGDVLNWGYDTGTDNADVDTAYACVAAYSTSTAVVVRIGVVGGGETTKNPASFPNASGDGVATLTANSWVLEPVVIGMAPV